jgi:hypothetical protein
MPSSFLSKITNLKTVIVIVLDQGLKYLKKKGLYDEKGGPEA